MLHEGRDDLICDLAETYRIYDMKKYPVTLIATLAAGLKEDSRVRMKIEGRKLSTRDCLLALIFDKINGLCYSLSEDAKHKRNKPVSLYNYLNGFSENSDSSQTVAFNTPEEFEKKRKELIGG